MKKKAKKKEKFTFEHKGHVYSVGDNLVVKFPYLKKEVKARIHDINLENGNVTIIDIKRQFFRGFNIYSLEKFDIEIYAKTIS
jgi:hypothetical protein